MIVLFYDFTSDVLLPETFFINVKNTALERSLANVQPYDDIPDSVIRSPDLRGLLLGVLESRAILKLNRGSDVVSKITDVQANAATRNRNSYLTIEFTGALGVCQAMFIATSVRNGLLRITINNSTVSSHYTWQEVGLLINQRGFNLRDMIGEMGESMFESAKRRFEGSWPDELEFVDGRMFPTYSARLLDGEWLWTQTMDFKDFGLSALFG